MEIKKLIEIVEHINYLYLDNSFWGTKDDFYTEIDYVFKDIFKIPDPKDGEIESTEQFKFYKKYIKPDAKDDNELFNDNRPKVLRIGALEKALEKLKLEIKNNKINE